MGVWENVTIVSMSEFGRTLTSNGRGTDHGWGGNHFVLGGGIRGGQIHGKYLPSFKSGSSHVLGTNALRALPALPWEAMWQPIAKVWPHPKPIAACLLLHILIIAHVLHHVYSGSAWMRTA